MRESGCHLAFLAPGSSRDGWGEAGLGSESVNLALGLCGLVFLSGGQEVLWGPVQSSPHQTLLTTLQQRAAPGAGVLELPSFPKAREDWLATRQHPLRVSSDRRTEKAPDQSARPVLVLTHRSRAVSGYHCDGGHRGLCSGVTQAEPLSEMQGHS